MSLIDKINNLYTKLENIMIYLAGFLLVAMMGLVGIEIISRKILGSSISGVFEITTELMPAVTLLGIAFVQRNKEHIQIDIFIDKLPKQFLNIIEIVVNVIVTIFLFVFATKGFANFTTAFNSGEHTIGTMSVPLWPGKLTVSIAFYLASIRFFLDSILQTCELFKNKTLLKVKGG